MDARSDRLTGRTIGALGAAAASAAGLLLLAASFGSRGALAVRTVDDAVTVAAHVVGAAVLLWYLVTAVVAAACLAARAAGAAWVGLEAHVARLGAPVLRRALVAGGGALVAMTAVLAPATAVPDGVADDLGWGATAEPAPQDDGSPPAAPPEGAGAGAATPESDAGNHDPAGGADPTTPEAPEEPEAGDVEVAPAAGSLLDASTYTVVEGDSLWAIAQAALPGDPDVDDVARAWPAWYEANRDVVGPDPDLIHPGQVLLVPDHDTEEHA